MKCDARYPLKLECGQPSDARARSIPELWRIPHARARSIPELFDACPPLQYRSHEYKPKWIIL